MKFWGLALLVAAATPSAAYAQAAPAAQQSASAQRFARAYLPIEGTTEAARQAFRRGFAQNFDAVPQNAALEKRFPGSRAAAQAAGERELVAIYRREIPAVQARVARYAEANYTPLELDQISAFIESPAGRSLLAGVSAGPLATRIAGEVRAGGRPKVTQADIAGLIDPAVVETMPEDQLRALIAFTATPAALKFNANGTALAQLVADQTVVMVQTAQPRMMQAISSAIAAHVGQAK